MSTITKLELTQANNALTLDNMALRAKVAQLEGDIERITSVASAMNKAHAPQATNPPRWQVERAEAMRIAKGMAMAARMVIKV